jgi:hypothetical protein
MPLTRIYPVWEVGSDSPGNHWIRFGYAIDKISVEEDEKDVITTNLGHDDNKDHHHQLHPKTDFGEHEIYLSQLFSCPREWTGNRKHACSPTSSLLQQSQQHALVAYPTPQQLLNIWQNSEHVLRTTAIDNTVRRFFL